MSQVELAQELEWEEALGLSVLDEYERTEVLRDAWSDGLQDLFEPLLRAEIAKDLGFGQMRYKVCDWLFQKGIVKNGRPGDTSWIHTLEHEIYEPLDAGWERGAHIEEAKSFYDRSRLAAKYFKLGWFLRALRMGYFSVSDCPRGEAPAFGNIGFAEKYRDQDLKIFQNLGFLLVTELERNPSYSILQERIENHPEKIFDWQAGQIEQYRELLKQRLLMKLVLGIIPFSNLNYAGPATFICPSTLKFKRAGLWHEEKGSLDMQLNHEDDLEKERAAAEASLSQKQKRQVYRFLNNLRVLSAYLDRQHSQHVREALLGVQEWIDAGMDNSFRLKYTSALQEFRQEEEWDRISFGF